MKKIVHAASPHDCPDACGVLIAVEDGRATRIQGDPAHPMTRGFLCAKVAKYLDRVYSPDRLLYPMRRIRAKGPGNCNAGDFERISWDEALDEIIARLKKISSEFGAEAILPYSYGGTLGTLNNSGMAHRNVPRENKAYSLQVNFAKKLRAIPTRVPGSLLNSG